MGALTHTQREIKMSDAELKSKSKSEVKEPKLWNVILHNDDVTPFDLVIQILIEVFGHSTDTATAITMNIHEQGAGVAGTYVFEIAEHKAEFAMEIAGNFKFPLKATIEEQD